MRILPIQLAVAVLATASAFAAGKPLATVSVSNPSPEARSDAFVRVPLKGLPSPLDELVLQKDGMLIPTQLVDLDADGNDDALAATLNIGGNETVQLNVVRDALAAAAAPFPRRAQADLAIRVGGKFVKDGYEGGTYQNVASIVVPPEHTIHSGYLRYEGPGIESDKVAYRVYLDPRNGFDIFGKRHGDMVLQRVGLDGLESYHNLTDWGMDILKVGDAVGIGAPAYWDGSKILRIEDTEQLSARITENGPVYSCVNILYKGWKIAGKQTDLDTVLSMVAGNRMVHVKANPSKALDNLATGIVKHPGTKVLKTPADKQGWGYLATWGKQTLNDDMLGMVIFYRNSDAIEVTEDAYNHVVVLKPNKGKFDYFFAAAWELEQNGIKTEAQFQDWLDQTVSNFDQPLDVTVKARK